MRARSTTLVISLSAVWIWTACSSESPPEPGNPEGVQKTSERVQLSCPNARFGAACDPDGDTPTFGECDGLCTFENPSPSGRVVCTPITDLALPNLEHYLCGSGATCTETCNISGQCVAAQALDGTPCAGATPNSKCSGQCLAGACQSIVNPCPFGGIS